MCSGVSQFVHWDALWSCWLAERGQVGSHIHMADSVNGGLLLTVSLALECQKETKGWVGQREINGSSRFVAF